MWFGDPLLNQGDYSAKPTSHVLPPFPDTWESLRSCFTVGFRDLETEAIAHDVSGRISDLSGDKHTCYIGLTKPASVTLLTYDL
jgi:hypothetical protein